MLVMPCEMPALRLSPTVRAVTLQQVLLGVVLIYPCYEWDRATSPVLSHHDISFTVALHNL